MRPPSAHPADGAAVPDALRAGDEPAFSRLLGAHGSVLLAVARCHDARCGQQDVQDTWLAFSDGLDRFDGSSSLKSRIVRLRTIGRLPARAGARRMEELDGNAALRPASGAAR